MRHAYKEMQLRQLRGFCETARLGSLSAAAEALGLAQPTVWEQVRALEREFNAPLVEAHGRGCRLTDDGRLLAQLLAPLIAGIDALKHNFQEARAQVETWLTLASTQRVLVEDLPAPLREFERRHPHARLRFVELRGDQISGAVEAREADLGLGTGGPASPPNPWLEFEPLYELDPILITPKNHPLARRRRVRPGDLKGFPLLNAAKGGFADHSIAATLEKLGVFETQTQRLEAVYSAVIRRYVELGFGIGIVPGLPRRTPSESLHERSMSHYFGRVPVYLISRRGGLHQKSIQAFAQTIKSMLNPRAKGGKNK